MEYRYNKGLNLEERYVTCFYTKYDKKDHYAFTAILTFSTSSQVIPIVPINVDKYGVNKRNKELIREKKDKSGKS